MAATAPEGHARDAAAPEGGFAPLLSERLRLRPLRAEDAPAVFRLVNDWEVARNLARVPFPYPRELADDWIASTRRRLETGEELTLAITGREDDTLVGVVGLTIDRTRREARLGYWVGRRFWGHGAAGEAAARLVAYAFAQLPVDRITANVLADNAASIRVLEKAGLKPAGEGEEEFQSHQRAMPVRVFALSRADLLAAHGLGAAKQPEAARPIVLVSAVALVDGDGRVLLAQRPEGKALAGLWEFPGGKVAPGETPEAALIREMKEELGIDVTAACLAPFAFASHAYEAFHLLMPLYLCRRWIGTPRAIEGQQLAWVRPARLADYPMPPADKPLVALLRDFL